MKKVELHVIMIWKDFFSRTGAITAMIYDIQSASLWKRISAGIFDAILTVILAVGIALVLSVALGYDATNAEFEQLQSKYEEEYSVKFDIPTADYEKLSEAEREAYDGAYAAFIKDDRVLYLYNMIVNLSILMTTLSILVSDLLLEFLVPIIIGNGQTLGKKIFGIGLVRSDCVKITNFQLLVRTLLGKFAVETMIPIYIILMIFWGTMDITGTFVVLIILLTQLIMITVTKTNSLLHDMLSVTAAVDISSQMIFETPEAKIEYQKKLAAERAARQSY